MLKAYACDDSDIYAAESAEQVAKLYEDMCDEKPDEGARIGWFANAIMAGYDSAMLRSNAR